MADYATVDLLRATDDAMDAIRHLCQAESLDNDVSKIAEVAFIAGVKAASEAVMTWELPDYREGWQMMESARGPIGAFLDALADTIEKETNSK